MAVVVGSRNHISLNPRASFVHDRLVAIDESGNRWHRREPDSPRVGGSGFLILCLCGVPTVADLPDATPSLAARRSISAHH